MANAYIKVTSARGANADGTMYNLSGLVSGVSDGTVIEAVRVSVDNNPRRPADGKTTRNVIVITKANTSSPSTTWDANGYSLGFALADDGTPDLSCPVLISSYGYVNTLNYSPYEDSAIVTKNVKIKFRNAGDKYIIYTDDNGDGTTEATPGALRIEFIWAPGTFKIWLKSDNYVCTGAYVVDKSGNLVGALASYDDPQSKTPQATTRNYANFNEEIVVEYSRNNVDYVQIVERGSRCQPIGATYDANLPPRYFIARLGVFHGDERLTPATIGDRFVHYMSASANVMSDEIESLTTDEAFTIKTEMREFSIDSGSHQPAGVWKYSGDYSVAYFSVINGKLELSTVGNSMDLSGRQLVAPPQDYIQAVKTQGIYGHNLEHPAFELRSGTFRAWYIGKDKVKDLDGEIAEETDCLNFKHGDVIRLDAYFTMSMAVLALTGISQVDYEVCVDGEKITRFPGTVTEGNGHLLTDIVINNNGTWPTIHLKATVKEGYVFDGWWRSEYSEGRGEVLLDPNALETTILFDPYVNPPTFFSDPYFFAKAIKEGEQKGSGQLLCDNYGKLLYDDGEQVTLRAERNAVINLNVHYHDNDEYSNHSVTGYIKGGNTEHEIDETIDEPGSVSKSATCTFPAVVVGSRYGIGSGKPIYFDKGVNSLTKCLVTISVRCQIAGHRYDIAITASENGSTKELYRQNNLSGTFTRTFEV